jgi:hypothetical protein
MRKRLKKKLARADRSLEGFMRDTFSDEFLQEAEVEYQKARSDALRWKLGRCPCHLIPIE